MVWPCDIAGSVIRHDGAMVREERARDSYSADHLGNGLRRGWVGGRDEHSHDHDQTDERSSHFGGYC